MPIQIDLRQNSQIIQVSSPGKQPILSRKSSFHFYNPLELLCVSLGACFGQELWYLCYYDNKNPEIFESIVITMEEFEITITIQHPKDLDDAFKERIQTTLNSCPVASQLVKKPKLVFIENKISTEVLVDQTRKGNCCSGNK